MNQSEFRQFSTLLSETAEYYRQPLAPATVKIYWAALQRYELATFRTLLDEHVKTQKFLPTVAELLDGIRLMDGRPDVEEAWSIVSQSLNDEGVTIVWTQEMASAFGVALGAREDRVAARMAFKESYNRALRDARRKGTPVKWTPSFGTDSTGRDGPLIKAVAEGKLLAEHVQQFLSAPEAAEEMKRLVFNIGKRPPAIERKREPGDDDEPYIQA